MTALHRKLFREVWKQRYQMLSIAAVVAVGMITVLTLRGTYESLVLARDAYYHAARFPDVWVELKRAPESVARRLGEIPGVSAVDTRVTFTATLDVPGLEVPALGRFISIPDRGRPALGDLYLKRGRYIAPDRRNEVLISEKFALANALGPGSTISAVINGRLRDLLVAGTAISPEYSYAVPPGSLFPDNKRYGIIWMSRESVGPAYEMRGAFNEAVFTLSSRAEQLHVLAAIDRLLAPYGGLGAYARKDQLSHQLIQSELDSDRTLGTAMPIVFLGVAAFLLNIVLNRLIATQRTEIAVLKAFGYNNVRIGWHYLNFATAAVLAGTAAGIVLGIWLGGAMVEVYGTYFDFPALSYHISWALVAGAAMVGVLASGAGALGAVRRATRLPPAEAMRPEAPATFRAGVFERLGLARALPASGRMILRNIERQPFRSIFSAIGVAFSVAILFIGMAMFDGVEYMMDLQFRVAERQDLSVTFNNPLSASVVDDLKHLPGVMEVEPFRTVPVRLTAGQRKREVGITGLEPATRLRRIVTADGRIQELPPEGLILSAILANQLSVVAGDFVTVEILEGDRRSAAVPVSGVVEDFLGLSAYMQLDALHRLTRGARAISGAYLAVAQDKRQSLNADFKRLPVVGSVASPAQMLQTFQDEMAKSLIVSILFILVISAVIAVAVIYNGARIALSERGRELASLRVLGFSRGEVAALLLGEQALVTLLAIPLGCALGYGLSAAVFAGLATETYRIPMTIGARTYLWAAAITVAAAAVSGWIVRRRLDRMDLISALKTRE